MADRAPRRTLRRGPGRGGPGDEDACVEERRAWELELGAGGWIGLSWPKEYGGREASLLEQVIFYEEYARGRAGRSGSSARVCSARRSSTSAATSRSAASSPGSCRARDLVPGLLGAERGLRSRERADARGARRRRVGRDRAEGVDVARALGAVVLRALPHEPRRAAPPRPVVPARPDGPTRHRDPPDPAAHRHVGVQRGLLLRGAHRRRERGRRGRRRLARRDGHARVRAGRIDARAAARVRERAPRGHRRGRAPECSRRRPSASGSPTRGSRCG